MRLSYIYAKIFDCLRGKAVLDSTIHRTACVGAGCNIVNLTLGRYSYIGHDCQIVNTEIGAFCSISDHVFIGGAEHPMHWLSTSPVFQNIRHSGPTKRFAKFELLPSKLTFIGNDVWIGHGVTIKQGIKIGDGAVIGSNALVTKDVPPYAIIGGVPSKVLKYRFPDDIISQLLNIKWWNISDGELQHLAEYAKDPNVFIKKMMLEQSE